jgi:3-oxoacyl-[acyl-carrier protein] reductase
MINLLVGKKAIVTGCSRGIGKSVCEIFAEQGCHVICQVRQLSSELEIWAKNLEKRHAVEISFLECDLGDTEQIRAAIRGCLKEVEHIDILVNNAGITHNSFVQMTKISDIESQLAINFTAPFYLTQFVLKKMVKNRVGSIINIASTAAFDGNLGKATYGASKAALVAMSKSLSKEVGALGIRVNTVSPGITATDMLASMSADVIDEAVISSDNKQSAQPTDIADACLFFASDLSSYITGQDLRVDGGM